MNTLYTFTTSQPLTQQQLDYLNNCLNNLPTLDTTNLLDIPEWTTIIQCNQ